MGDKKELNQRQKEKQQDDNRLEDEARDEPESDIEKTLHFFSTTVDESLESKGIVLLENEVDYPGITLHAKKLVMDIASSPSANYMEVYINSCGGEIVQFLALHDAILMAQKLYKTQVTTIVNGIAASAAAIVLQAGYPRIATKNSYIMIHEVSFGVEGTFSNAQAELASVKRVQNTAFKIWADKMGITIKELFAIMNGKDVYYSAKEARKIGLVDKII